jgi:hypothetical protein
MVFIGTVIGHWDCFSVAISDPVLEIFGPGPK